MPKFSANERAEWLRLSEAAVDGFIRTAGWKTESPLLVWAPPRSLLYVPAADLLVGPFTIGQAIDGGSFRRGMKDLRCDGLSLAVGIQANRPFAIKAVLGLWSRREISWFEDLTLYADGQRQLWLASEAHIRKEDRSAWMILPSGLQRAPLELVDDAAQSLQLALEILRVQEHD